MEWRVKESNGAKMELELSKYKQHPLRKGWARIRVNHSALNKRDEWITLRMYPRIKAGVILGSDACGVCVDIHMENPKQEAKLREQFISKEVIPDSCIGWSEKGFTILGMPEDGTFASFVDVPIENLYLKPDFLTSAQAAALPLAGSTAYRALFTKGKVQPDSRVLVTGIGGGVAMFALQFAIAIGAEVFVTSSDEAKIKFAKSLGAKEGVNYKNATWTKDLKKILESTGNKQLLDVIIDGAGGETIADFLRLVRMNARIVSYGATAGSSTTITLPHLFLNNVDLLGTAMGSPEDYQGMLELVNKYKIVPVVDSITDLEKLPEAIGKMSKAGQTGKLVLVHPKL